MLKETINQIISGGISMAIDFKKKLSTRTIAPKTDPIELYGTLDRKSVAGPLRPAQKAILSEWYTNRRNDKDLIIKLHTGEGKTLVGLLLLQSQLNSKNGPCLYICPNKYLVKQVCAEADKFGIPYCIFDQNNEIPNDFLSGAKILITYVHKVFNGRSIFGTNNSYTKTGTVLLDDSHACIDTIKKAFTISISKTENANVYSKFLKLFSDDMIEQGEGSWLDIKSGDYNTFMTVPYWSWNNKKTEVLKILLDEQNNRQIYFVWPLIRNQITNYCCYISGTKIEISPYNVSIHTFGSFSHAEHRILMSATTQDDSFFVKGLDFSPEAIRKPLLNLSQKWSGEKMLIIPSLVDDTCDHDLIVTNFCKMQNQNFGIIALVPSTRNSMQYQDLGAIITNTDNIFREIDNLKRGCFSKIVVVNNRYDGIDLPDESCRILILDNLPYFDSLADRYEELSCPNSKLINKRIAQKIEQGMGRGVRGEKDYCAILVIGSELVRFMRSIATNKFFSAQTRKQIEIGIEIANMAKQDYDDTESPIKSVYSLISQMLKRDEGWKEYYSSEMNTIEEDEPESTVYERLIKERQAEEFFSKGEYSKASSTMQQLINDLVVDDAEKGWYMQQLARYTYYKNAVMQSIQIQKSAFQKNPQLLKPIAGIDYTKISYINQNQLNNIRTYMRRFSKFDELSLDVNAILDNLSFGIDATKFESALKEIGELLGYISQRPDKEIRKGPDNLWCGSNNYYLLFECKSEVYETRQEISKHEAGQMNNHCAWFEEQYGKNAKVDRFMIIPTKTLSYEADFTHNVRIIRRNGLKNLKNQIKCFIKELEPYFLDELSDATLQDLLNLHCLNIEVFSAKYSEEYYHKTK